ncbi:glycosyltransferase family 4 protein [Adhaeribacter aquaticus]|uniref:glycosyltransferase family 4 protein n=1 Tax=Adhaeribacter aquaticus TaxID=299567 RepID=UPI00040E9B52|nr:glycosyltransferase family 4 protein [Adhaeribacter aquaticus]
MRILYIHQYFKKPAEGGALRSYFLAKALVAAGHEVELITAYNGTVYKQEEVAGVLVHYLPIAYDNSFHPGQRLASFASFMVRATLVALKRKHIDVCYATSTPLTVGLIALVLKKLKNIPFYFEVRDLWPEAPIQLGYIKSKWAQGLLYKLEQTIYKQAEKVIALSPGIAAGITRNKPTWAIPVIPNMADVDYHRPTYPVYSPNHDLFYIGYFGTIGRANRLDFLLNIAKSVQEQHLNQVKFIIGGTGAETSKLREETYKLGISNITWTGSLNREQVRQYLALCHATYTSFDVHPILQTNSPNKFFESLAAGKLTLVNTKGWLQTLVTQNKCGFYADPNNPEEFIQKLTPYLHDADLLRRAQQNARQLAEQQFSRQKLCQEFLQLFTSH